MLVQFDTTKLHPSYSGYVSRLNVYTTKRQRPGRLGRIISTQITDRRKFFTALMQCDMQVKRQSRRVLNCCPVGIVHDNSQLYFCNQVRLCPSCAARKTVIPVFKKLVPHVGPDSGLQLVAIRSEQKFNLRIQTNKQQLFRQVRRAVTRIKKGRGVDYRHHRETATGAISISSAAYNGYNQLILIRTTLLLVPSALAAGFVKTLKADSNAGEVYHLIDDGKRSLAKLLAAVVPNTATSFWADVPLAAAYCHEMRHVRSIINYGSLK